MTFAHRIALGSFAGLLLMPLATQAQQQLPTQLQSGTTSEVPVATQVMRWRMNDADVNSFAFRNMDQLFTTRSVAHSGAPWTFPKVERPMDFTYVYGGKTFAADQALERTYTNALLIMKDGRIVTEIYRNGSSERTRFMGWSMTKSITSTLVGAALADGLVASLDDPITRYLPELKGSGYDGVTILQILQMRSGVDYEERYDFDNPGIAAWFGSLQVQACGGYQELYREGRALPPILKAGGFAHARRMSFERADVADAARRTGRGQRSHHFMIPTRHARRSTVHQRSYPTKPWRLPELCCIIPGAIARAVDMRMAVTRLMGILAVCGGSSAAYACDIEGFGIARMNPFGQHASWNVPEQPTSTDQSRNATLIAAEQSDAPSSATRVPATDPAINDRAAADVASISRAASKQTPAEQAQRFAASKD